MAAVRITLLSRRGAATVPADLRGFLRSRHEVDARALRRPPSRAQAEPLLARTHVLAATNACLPSLDDRLLTRTPHLRHVVLYATGSDHLDTAALHRAGVELTVLPDYATVAVAEHTLALLLALATRLHLANDRSRGIAPPEVSLRGVELHGKVLGVIGLGRIGSQVARLGRGIGMQVVAHDHRPDVAARAVPPGSLLSLEAVLARSDAVCVCASRAYGQRALLGARELAMMRPGAFLVNAGRPALVDTRSVVDALRAGRLRGYAVDDAVLDPARDADLASQGRVLQTGHSAWWRDEVLARGARMWGEAILDVADRLSAAASGTVTDTAATAFAARRVSA